MQNNRIEKFLLEQEIKQLKEKVKDLEYVIELYRNKQEHSKELNEQLKARLDYLESFLGNEPDNIKPLKAIKGGMYIDVTNKELLDGI